MAGSSTTQALTTLHHTPCGLQTQHCLRYWQYLNQTPHDYLLASHLSNTAALSLAWLLCMAAFARTATMLAACSRHVPCALGTAHNVLLAASAGAARVQQHRRHDHCGSTVKLWCHASPLHRLRSISYTDIRCHSAVAGSIPQNHCPLVYLSDNAFLHTHAVDTPSRNAHSTGLRGQQGVAPADPSQKWVLLQL